MILGDPCKCLRCSGFLVYDPDLLGMVCLNCGRCYYKFTPYVGSGRKEHNVTRPVDGGDICHGIP